MSEKNDARKEITTSDRFVLISKEKIYIKGSKEKIVKDICKMCLEDDDFYDMFIGVVQLMELTSYSQQDGLS